jgi:hypothetical protein
MGEMKWDRNDTGIKKCDTNGINKKAGEEIKVQKG